MSLEKYKNEKRLVERTHHSPYLYAAAFGRVVHSRGVETVVDVAAGDSEYAASRVISGQRVIRVDRDYGRVAPRGDDWLAASAEKMPFEDGSVDAVISAFLMQHLSPEQQTKAISEMLRIAKPYRVGENRGFVGLYPVYDYRKMEDKLKRTGFWDQIGLATDFDAFDGMPLDERRLKYPTLWIPKWQSMDADERQSLVRAAVESGAFYRRRTAADVARQLAMRAAGDTRVHTK